MALINCPNCNGIISDKASICPHCECNLERKANQTCRFLKIMLIITGLAIICFFATYGFVYILGATADDVSTGNIFEYENSDYSHFSSYSAPVDHDSSLKLNQEKKADNLEKNLEATGQIVFRSGYTFDECVKVARRHMRSEYGVEFYNTSVVVSTEDMKSYFVVGYTETDKVFEVCIYHSAGSWDFVTAIY